MCSQYEFCEVVRVQGSEDELVALFHRVCTRTRVLNIYKAEYVATTHCSGLSMRA